MSCKSARRFCENGMRKIKALKRKKAYLKDRDAL